MSDDFPGTVTQDYDGKIIREVREEGQSRGPITLLLSHPIPPLSKKERQLVTVEGEGRYGRGAE